MTDLELIGRVLSHVLLAAAALSALIVSHRSAPGANDHRTADTAAKDE